jgi:hypothetical protein
VHGFRRPGLRVLHLKLPACIDDADGRIYRSDLLNRMVTDGAQK